MAKDLTDREKRREQRATEREDARFERAARDSETIIATSPSEVTALDAMGVERIVTTTFGYDAPQVEPDPKEVERLKNLQKRLDNKKSERLAQLTTTPDGSAKVAADAIKAESSVGTPTQDTTTATSTTPPTTSTPTPSTPTPPSQPAEPVKADEDADKKKGGS